MTASAPGTTTLASALPPGRESAAARLIAIAWRYGLSTSGPIAISGAHFVVSLIFLRNLPAAAFGIFSFVMIVVPFCLSITTALLSVPVATALRKPEGLGTTERATFIKMNLVLGAGAMIATALLLALSGASLATAALLGVYGGAMTLRWFARSYSYIEGYVVPAVFSDLIYAGLLTAGIAALLFAHLLTLTSAALVLIASSLLASLVFGSAYFHAQFEALRSGKLTGYAVQWRDLTRWSLLGVVFTEITANAHAYLVTFISGPKSFALLALGTLLMRPISLVQSALPDLERPAMARAIAAKDNKRGKRIVGEFTAAVSIVWLGTIALSAALLIWFPHLILKNGYDERDVIIVVMLSAVIMAIRTWRTSEAVFLQAAGQFKDLAGIGWISGSVSVAATLGLLLAFGPIASLGGIILGDLIILVRCLKMARAWRAAHA